MTSRAEVATRYAKAYVKASKEDKGRILDAVVEVMGWSRDNARRRLIAAAKTEPVRAVRSRRGRGSRGVGPPVGRDDLVVEGVLLPTPRQAASRVAVTVMSSNG